MRSSWFPIVGLAAGLAAVSADQIMTVTGPIDPVGLGLTLPHEHVLVDFVGADQVSPDRYDRAEVLMKMAAFVVEAREAGVITIVETTPAFIGRDPKLLHELHERVGVQFVTNTGLYGAVNDKFLPPYAYTESAQQLADRWITEFRDGIEGTGIRPGFIKSAVDREAELSDIDAKLIHAAALTHLETGLTIAVHTGPGPGLSQIDILTEHGVHPSAWIWVHAQNADEAAMLEAAERGAWISLDGVRERSLDRHVERILLLRERGMLDQIIVSQDAGWFDPAKPEGGDPRGYVYLFDALIPRLIEAGLSEAEIAQLTISNPARSLTLRVRQID